jgi:hypothetical protein
MKTMAIRPMMPFIARKAGVSTLICGKENIPVRIAKRPMMIVVR